MGCLFSCTHVAASFRGLITSRLSMYFVCVKQKINCVDVVVVWWMQYIDRCKVASRNDQYVVEKHTDRCHITVTIWLISSYLVSMICWIQQILYGCEMCKCITHCAVIMTMSSSILTWHYQVLGNSAMCHAVSQSYEIFSQCDRVIDQLTCVSRQSPK